MVHVITIDRQGSDRSLETQGLPGPGTIQRFAERRHRLRLEHPPELIWAGSSSAVWRLRTACGEYLAKVFTARTRDVRIVRKEVAIYAWLRRFDIHVPEVSSTVAGRQVETLTVGSLVPPRFERFPAMVMRLEKLRTIQPESVTRDELRLIARRLASIHESLRQYPDRDGIRRSDLWDIEQSSFTDFLRSPNAHLFETRDLEGLHELDQRMELVTRSVQLPSPLTESVLHGDLGMDHVQLLDGDHPHAGEPYFFDFSDFVRGPVALELAIMLLHLFGRSTITFTRWKELGGWVLEGYCSATRLTDDDVRAIDALLVPWALTSIRYQTRRAIRSGAPGNVAQIRRRYQLAAHLLNDDRPCTGLIRPESPHRMAPRATRPRRARAEYESDTPTRQPRSQRFS